MTPIKAEGDKPGGGAARGDDSCQYANDHECDEPGIGTGACRMNTDHSDCVHLRTGEDDSCQWHGDGECDEPNFGSGACTQGTDRADCGNIAWLRNQNDSCATAFNGVCEEPGHGSGSCRPHTDRADCLGRNRPMAINDHFFGHDDRVLVPVNQAPWRFVGALNMDRGSECTATLIAPNVIITAAHCINEDNGVDARATFHSASGNLSARVVAYLTDRRFDYHRFGSTNDIDGLDWALLRLDRPLGAQLGYAGVQNLTGRGAQIARAANLMQAGYAWDTGTHLAGDTRCHIVAIHRDNTFAHACDTTRGDSGSSFFVANGSGFDVIGVDSNFRSNHGGPIINIAVSAASFQPHVADFAAGRTGVRVEAKGK
ncbi:MAG: trypsin-like serine protease [Proteobacteria bacterium]|nr:trypsin-like serine protease [Pseudomonadota bacterium]